MSGQRGNTQKIAHSGSKHGHEFVQLIEGVRDASFGRRPPSVRPWPAVPRRQPPANEAVTPDLDELVRRRVLTRRDEPGDARQPRAVLRVPDPEAVRSRGEQPAAVGEQRAVGPAKARTSSRPDTSKIRTPAIISPASSPMSRQAVTSALVHPTDLLAQLAFTPLLAGWTIWIVIAISTRSNDLRVAQQLASLAGLPSVAVTTLIALNVLPVTLGLALAGAAVLLVLNRLGWRMVSAMFDRERLITGTW